ncbi:Na+/citrate or Na+/malate symporter [Cetobacterium ceti]|uniref:Na+/citrate or Na+/malate symporter n=1 Tax=Cetobacterium ceti TaxID=180163 RepID=A0A1T4KV93_9FUSO|nr:2-hydroxycarboxylate transporter family protein [Cetobacterium ceti]SJZ46290.1 Na+/citrate or Na+/malate symporter [Cetobacterium ceti]
MAKNFKELFNPKEFKWGGLTLPVFLGMLIVTAIVVYVPFGGKEAGFLRPNFISILGILAVFGILFGEIGDRIPIWNDYIGGGTVLVFFMSAVMGTYNMVPATVLKSIDVFYGKQPVNFLEIFIPALIVGSILTVNRKTLVKSIVGYIPLLAIGVVGAAVGGVVIGLLFGKAPLDVIMNYVLPIMGGGTGAGAIPLSEMWGQKTGRNPQEWFAFAISILTIANVIAILTGALLKELGEKRPSLTGHGQLVVANAADYEEEKEEEAQDVGQQDFAAALFMTGIIFIIANLLSKVWSALNMPFEIHRLAFLVLIVIALNLMDVVPLRIKAGAKRMQSFFAKYTIWILMAAVGFGTDVQEIINALTFGNLIIAIGIVFGAVAAIMLLARPMKFYPIEAAITAGLCMANRGGSGDIAVLGAADRMNLISYAQISSRIGGAMVLILGSVIFGLFA